MDGTAAKLSPRTVFAASSGDVLEWYDFTAYSFLAPILGQSSFPPTITLPRSCPPSLSWRWDI
ncbi:MAG: hypothetical protein AAF583_13625 [Pseudomonadota bacterium]